MTGWISASNTRHIPEDELHAYLDQALSRSQCVEIECHLAECRHCQVARDEVASIRDQTTAMLSHLRPRRLSPPPFDELVARHHQRIAARSAAVVRYRRYGLLAASLIATVLGGWWAHSALSTHTLARTVGDSTPRRLEAVGPVRPIEQPMSTAAQAARDSAAPADRGKAPAPPASPERVAVKDSSQTAKPFVVQVSSLRADEADAAMPLDGLWQSVDWEEAQALTGSNVPRIEGLPVLEVQVQRGSSGERPLVVVVQQHPSGQLLQTIEGPASRVQELLSRRLGRDPERLHASEPSRTPPDYLEDGNGTGRRGLRVLSITGRLPVDSLNIMARGIELKK